MGVKLPADTPQLLHVSHKAIQLRFGSLNLATKDNVSQNLQIAHTKYSAARFRRLHKCGLL